MDDFDEMPLFPASDCDMAADDIVALVSTTASVSPSECALTPPNTVCAEFWGSPRGGSVVAEIKVAEMNGFSSPRCLLEGEDEESTKSSSRGSISGGCNPQQHSPTGIICHTNPRFAELLENLRAKPTSKADGQRAAMWAILESSVDSLPKLINLMPELSNGVVSIAVDSYYCIYVLFRLASDVKEILQEPCENHLNGSVRRLMKLVQLGLTTVQDLAFVLQRRWAPKVQRLILFTIEAVKFLIRLFMNHIWLKRCESTATTAPTVDLRGASRRAKIAEFMAQVGRAVASEGRPIVRDAVFALLSLTMPQAAIIFNMLV